MKEIFLNATNYFSHIAGHREKRGQKLKIIGLKEGKRGYYFLGLRRH